MLIGCPKPCWSAPHKPRANPASERSAMAAPVPQPRTLEEARRLVGTQVERRFKCAGAAAGWRWERQGRRPALGWSAEPHRSTLACLP